jgi:peptidase S41-like protein
MIKRCVLAALLACFAGPTGLLAAQAVENPDQSASARSLTSAELREDFDLMRAALEEAHSGLYRYSTKAEMDRVFDAERAKLNRPMTELEAMAVMSETVAFIRCGHTSVMPGDELGAAMKGARTLPLRLRIEGAKLVVLSNDTPDEPTIRPGMEVVEINGHRPADLVARFWPLEGGDGDIETGRRAHVQNAFPLYYWALVEQTSEFTVKARDEAGTMVTARLAGVTSAEREKNQNPVNAPVRAAVAKLDWVKGNQSLRFLHDPEVAEIRLRYFVGDDFPRWVEDTFKTLSEKKTSALIIDLRNNGGGEDMYGAMLVSYLTDKPFRYFDHIHMNTICPSFKDHSNWNVNNEAPLREGTTPDPAGGYLVTEKLHHGLAEQQPGKHPFLGKVYVLIDGGTFSTAADFCAVTHHLKRATFVGEETGGGYYGNNSGVSAAVTLPHSKLKVRVQMYEYWNAVPGYEGKRRGTIPDYPVQFRTADLLRGVDAPLELARKLAKADAK